MSRDVLEHAAHAIDEVLARRRDRPRPLIRVLLELARGAARRDDMGIGDQAAHGSQLSGRASRLAVDAQDRCVATCLPTRHAI